MRRQWGKAIALMAALGLLSAPGVAQQQGGKQNAPVATQMPQAQIALDLRSFAGAHQRHPVWLGIAKRGKGRKFGARSRWDYRR